MASYNRVLLIGNLGRDPELRYTQNQTAICNLNIATNEVWNDKSGNRQEKTEWHRVVIFDEKLSEIAEKYLRKGSKIYLEGQIQTRKWTDQSGQEKYSTEIVLNRFRGTLTMLDGKSESGGQERQGDTAQQGPLQGDQPTRQPESDLDDEIPF